ncbi:MAG: HU family DNA-binding protein [Candidatus Nealsonbacteria bacterium]|jgi:nucleoid DNA-binding protein|nr:HU family DNA-binding protein [Candidatus Nealsonbacteria bacterium]
MTKIDIVEALAKKTKCSKSCAGECLNVILEEITKSLKSGKGVVLTGFGSFLVAKRKARTGRNPQTGEALKIPARTVARFKAGKQLKDAVK